MKKIRLTLLSGLLFSLGLSAQNKVKGIVLDGNSKTPLSGVVVRVKATDNEQITDANGVFTLQNLLDGKWLVIFKLKGYKTQDFPITLAGKTINLGTILLYKDDFTENQELSTITITDDELDNDTSSADNISGLLQSSKDIFLKTAAFEFGSSFFSVRGLGSENGKVLLNGIEMNKLYSGRPQWSNWGGLNDVTRNQEFSEGLSPSNYTFGGLLGVTNINTRASEARPGGRISYASSNRSYIHRVMASYASGMLASGWAFTVAGSRREGKQGYINGSLYNANSILISVEKKLSNTHSLSFTSIAAFNRRGKSSPQTQEVFDLKGRKYNSYWGYQNGKIRNSRIKEVAEPILMLNHYWDISPKTTLNTNIAYQFGKIGNSRIDFRGTQIDGNAKDGNGNPFIIGLGGTNPDPTYYQKLPSYAIRQGNAAVYQTEQQFLTDGQLHWNALYQANIQNRGNSSYILYEDRNDDKQFTVNTVFETELTDHITLNAKAAYKKLKSHNFANVLDLLGGNGYLDVDSFADDYLEKQNNVQTPNRIVTVGDTFKYNYNLYSEVFNGFVQGQFTYKKVDFYIAGSLSRTTHQREGLYQNGKFVDFSFGKGQKLTFTGFGGKGGLTYKITGRHLLNANVGYLTKAPSIRNSFANSRESQQVVPNITQEKILTADASYILRTPMVQAKLTGFYTSIKDANEISFFFINGRSFSQEVLQGADKKYFGGELGIEAQITPTIKLKGAASVGQYTYDNNPNLYLYYDGVQQFSGKSNLKNYKVASGPQRAYSIGFEYRDPDYWWVGATTNFFSNTYVDVSPLTRTNLFSTDIIDGLPFNDYDPILAKKMLQQEKFDGYTVVNAVGGKSWKINDYYIGFFAGISNIFDTKYKTGGYEQGRNSDYRNLKNDKALKTPVFGSKYWYGRGTTYFLNINFSF